jgi:hypothetical protein
VAQLKEFFDLESGNGSGHEDINGQFLVKSHLLGKCPFLECNIPAEWGKNYAK